MHFDESAVVGAIRASLTPDLLKGAWRRAASAHPHAGHCYGASEAAWHMLGGRESGLVPMVGRDRAGGTHWWLRGLGGRILDPTAGQYIDLGHLPPHGSGKPCGFLTRQPSRRAAEVIRRASARLGSPTG